MGGTLEDPTYEDVCTDKTGHAETVLVEYDENRISFEKLLERFFELHDPTTLNKQGVDIGTQYRSAVFVDSKEERQVIENAIEKAENAQVFRRKIVTAIEEGGVFYRAEEYHQRYYEKQKIQK